MKIISNEDFPSFEDFLEIAWDYVSENVVSDEYWDENYDFIKELTFDMYNLYVKSLDRREDGTFVEPLSPKMYGKMLECFFSRLIRQEDTY
jgi:hypothetical protein